MTNGRGGRGRGNGDSEAPSPPRIRAGAAFAGELSFDGVHRHYGRERALDGFSFDIAAGEVVCLLGPSGSGKTTLLRVAAGIEPPTAGRVLLNGREVAGPSAFVPPERRSVGLMFQDFALFPHLSVLDNVAFGLKSLPKADARREARAILARVGLDRHAGDYPHTLSGGQQQRVALARAIVPRPSVILMDEPFSGLDVQLREQMQEETLGLIRETRSTCMIVTHHPEEAMRIGDRVAVMRGGRLEQAGKPFELYHTPGSLFVARLFSGINEVPAIVRDGGIATAFGTVPAGTLPDGEPVVVCIREAGIKVSAPGRALAGRVLHVTFLGDVGLLELAAEGFDRPLRVRVPEDAGRTKGAEVSIEIDLAKVLVFPAGE